MSKYERYRVGNSTVFDMVEWFVGEAAKVYEGMDHRFDFGEKVDWEMVEALCNDFALGDDNYLKCQIERDFKWCRLVPVMRRTAKWIAEGRGPKTRPSRADWIVWRVATGLQRELRDAFRESLENETKSAAEVIADLGMDFDFDSEPVLTLARPERMLPSKTEMLDVVKEIGYEWFVWD